MVNLLSFINFKHLKKNKNVFKDLEQKKNREFIKFYLFSNFQYYILYIFIFCKI